MINKDLRKSSKIELVCLIFNYEKKRKKTNTETLKLIEIWRSEHQKLAHKHTYTKPHSEL